MSSNTSVAITREASSVLDAVSKQTGISKLHLASEAIKVFFDPLQNPNLAEAVAAFAIDRTAGAKLFIDHVIASRSKEQS